MKLLDLDHGKASLELQPGEVGSVLDRLRAFGSMSIRSEATHDVVSVGAQEFVYFDEWDEPCLISSDATGTSILAEIAYGSSPRQAVAS